MGLFVDTLESLLKKVLCLFSTAAHSHQVSKYTLSVSADYLGKRRPVALTMGVN
jgi:hypothetical protein